MRLLCTAAFLIETSFGAIFFALPLRAMEAGATPFQIGLLGSMTLVCYVPLVLLVGHWADRYPARPMLLSGAGGLLIIAGALTAVRTVPALLTLSGFIGCALALFWPPLMVALRNGGRSPGGRTLNFFSISWSTGSIVAPLVSGFLYEISPQGPLVLSLVLSAGCASIMSRVPVGRPPAATDPHAEPFSMEPQHWTGFIGNFSCAVIHATFRNLFPCMAATLGISPSLLGILFTIPDLCRTGTFFLFIQHPAWPRRRNMLVTAGIILLLPLTVFIFSDQVLLFAGAFACLGVCCGIFYSLALFDALDRPSGAGLASGLLESLASLGYSTGSFIGGLTVRLSGALRAPYIFTAIFTVLTGIVQGILLHRGTTAGVHRDRSGRSTVQ